MWLVAAMAFSTLAASEASREVSRPYNMDRGMVHGSDSDPYVGTQPEFFRSEKGERWAVVSLEDASGRPVAGRIEVGGKAFAFCATTPEPIRVRGEKRIAVSATMGLCGTDPSVVTEGTIAVTFSRSRSAT
jgi:hypothetical protein